MDIWTASEETYKNGYAKGYEDGKVEYESLEKKIKELEKSNRNWRRKVQRLRNRKTTTNADRIRSMTDEELATYLIRLTEVVKTCDVCEPTYRENGDCDCHCENGVLRWLKMERED